MVGLKVPALVAVGALLLVAAFAMVATAHPGPKPAPWETRVLHDMNDDWGTAHVATQDGHDLVAMEVAEAYDPALKADALLFKLMLNGGYAAASLKPALKEVVSFKANGVAKSFEFTTGDNAAFTGTFDAVRGKQQVYFPDGGGTDGQRFYVTGVVKLATLGLKAGQKVSDFQVRGYAGTASGDTMVDCSGTPSEAEQGEPACYVKPDLTLRGPVQYASLALDAPGASAESGDNVSVALTVASLIKDPANDNTGSQVATLKVTAPAGVKAVVHTDTYHTGTATVALPIGGEAEAHLYLMPGGAARSGKVTLELATDLGGHVVRTFDLQILAPPPEDGGEGEDGALPDDDGFEPVGDGGGDGVPAEPGEPANASGEENGLLPGPGVAMAALLLAGSAFARRRK